MADIFDLAPLSETVTIRNIAVEVSGLALGDFLRLAKRFPQIITKLKGGVVTEGDWFDIGAEAVGAAIAAGCGRLGDDAAEKLFSRLVMGEQAALLAPIIALTMPDGPGPLVQALTKAMGATPSSNP
jgi:hypothetical protein